jgi:hypothetical protein
MTTSASGSVPRRPRRHLAGARRRPLEGTAPQQARPVQALPRPARRRRPRQHPAPVPGDHGPRLQQQLPGHPDRGREAPPQGDPGPLPRAPGRVGPGPRFRLHDHRPHRREPPTDAPACPCSASASCSPRRTDGPVAQVAGRVLDVGAGAGRGALACRLAGIAQWPVWVWTNAGDGTAARAVAPLVTDTSWLNLVWCAELTNRKLRRSAHRSVTDPETDIRKWINEWSKDPPSVRLDQVRRRDPRDPRRLLPTHHRLRTLASKKQGGVGKGGPRREEACHGQP